MSQVLRFAIIGCGKIAWRHAGHIQARGTLVAVCDVVKEKADALAHSYNARACYNPNDLLQQEKEIDIVAVCTPNGLHAQHTILALQAGFHVICEKPMALSSNDAQNMIDAASQSGKQLFVVKQNRYNPPVAAVKKVLEEERLGKIYSVQVNCFWNRNRDYYNDSWRGTRLLDGGTLYTQFSHFIDLLYWLVGDIQEVDALMANYAHKDIIEFEDTGAVTFLFKNGVIGALNYTVNSFDRNMEGSLTIFGEKGTIKIGGQYLNELEYQLIADYQISDLPAGQPANDYGTYTGSMSNHDKVYDNVIQVLQNQASVTTTAMEARKTVEIIEKIYQNARYI